jgi:hypothetical protein
MLDLGRREFITLLGGAAATWPLAARAQQAERMRRVGVLVNLAEGDSEGQARVAAFREALGKLGWTEGRSRLTIAGSLATQIERVSMRPSW